MPSRELLLSLVSYLFVCSYIVSCAQFIIISKETPTFNVLIFALTRMSLQCWCSEPKKNLRQLLSAT